MRPGLITSVPLIVPGWQMKRFTEAVKEKWEDAVVSLKEEMQALKDENTKLRAENNQMREEAGSSPAPSPPEDKG